MQRLIACFFVQLSVVHYLLSRGMRIRWRLDKTESREGQTKPNERGLQVRQDKVDRQTGFEHTTTSPRTHSIPPHPALATYQPFPTTINSPLRHSLQLLRSLNLRHPVNPLVTEKLDTRLRLLERIHIIHNAQLDDHRVVETGPGAV